MDNSQPAIEARGLVKRFEKTTAYQVHVQTNGCYTADGDGPADLNGQQLITAADGATVTNPLWEFDGCFDTT